MGVRQGEDVWKRELNARSARCSRRSTPSCARYGVPLVDDDGTALKPAAGACPARCLGPASSRFPPAGSVGSSRTGSRAACRCYLRCCCSPPSRAARRGDDRGGGAARRASAPAADLAARPAARGPRLRRRAGSRPRTTPPPARFMGQEFTLEEVAVPPEEAVAALEALLGAGRRLRRHAGRRRHHAGARRRGRRAGADPERARARRPAARRRLPGEPAAPRAEPGDARPTRSAQYLASSAGPTGSSSRARTPRTGARRRLPPNAAEKFGADDRRDPHLRGYRRRAPHRIPATSRSRRRCRSSPSARPSHDVLVAADENEVFAAWLPYHTWDAAPGRGLGGAVPDHLASGDGGLGRHPVADPLREAGGPAACARRTTTPGWRCAPLGEAATRARVARPRRRCATTSSAPTSSSAPSRASR